MTTSESDHPRAAPFSPTPSQRRAVLAWSLALPFGWLLGWAMGAAAGYTNPALLRVSPRMDWAVAQKIGASDGGLWGGAIGVSLGLMAAAWMTVSALHPALPAQKPLLIALVVLSWMLPWVLCLLVAYFLVGRL